MWALQVDVATIDFEKADLRVPAIRKLIVQESERGVTVQERAPPPRADRCGWGQWVRAAQCRARRPHFLRSADA